MTYRKKCCRVGCPNWGRWPKSWLCSECEAREDKQFAAMHVADERQAACARIEQRGEVPTYDGVTAEMQ